MSSVTVVCRCLWSCLAETPQPCAQAMFNICLQKPRVVRWGSRPTELKNDPCTVLSELRGTISFVDECGL